MKSVHEYTKLVYKTIVVFTSHFWSFIANIIYIYMYIYTCNIYIYLYLYLCKLLKTLLKLQVVSGAHFERMVVGGVSTKL